MKEHTEPIRKKRWMYNGLCISACTLNIPQKVYHDRSSRCVGCPYARHGQMCWSRDGSCLRTDMMVLEEKHKRERRECAPVG